MYKVIGNDKKEYGPVSAEMIREWIKQGRLNRQTLIQPADATQWKPLGQQPEFAADLSLEVPPAVATPRVAAAPVPGGGGINTVIPYKNVPALVAYYLGVFSLIPVVGIVLGLAAFVLGIMGLRFHRQNPTAGGAVHAWIGIILGGLCGLGWLALIVLAFSAIHRH